MRSPAVEAASDTGGAASLGWDAVEGVADGGSPFTAGAFCPLGLTGVIEIPEAVSALGDELAISGPSSVAELKDGKITAREVHPEDAGLPTHPFNEILGGTPAETGAALSA